MSEPKFLAKNKDNTLPAPIGGKMVGYNRITEEINLDGLSLEHFRREVESVLSRRRPAIFKAWGNRRLELDVERIGIMRNALSQMQCAIGDMARLKATDFLSERIFQCETAFIEKELQIRAANLQAEYQDIIHRQTMDQLIEERERSDIDRIKAETLVLNLQARAKVQLLNAKTAEIQAQAKLVESLTDKLLNDEQSLSELAKLLLISGAMKSNQPINQQTMMMDKLEDIILDKFTAEVNLKKAEAESKWAQTNIDRAKSKHAVKSFSQFGDTVEDRER